MVSYSNQLRSLKQRSLRSGGRRSGSYLVLWWAMCLFEIAVFEVDASATQALVLQKRKKKLSGLTLQMACTGRAL